MSRGTKTGRNCYMPQTDGENADLAAKQLVGCEIQHFCGVDYMYIAVVGPRLREFIRQVEAEVINNIRNKIHQTWGPLSSPPLYYGSVVCVDGITQPFLSSFGILKNAEWFKKLREPVTFRAATATRSSSRPFSPARPESECNNRANACAPTGVPPLALELTLLSCSTNIQTGSSAASDSQNKDGRCDKLSNRELNEVSAVSQSIC